MPECDFKPNDEVCKHEAGGVLCGRVVSVSGAMMRVNIHTPKIGEIDTTVSGWENVKKKARARTAPRGQ